MCLILQISQALLHEMFDEWPYLNSPKFKICKLSHHPIRLVLKLGTKINPKQNALSGFKLLSRDSGSHIPYKNTYNNVSSAKTSCSSTGPQNIMCELIIAV